VTEERWFIMKIYYEEIGHRCHWCGMKARLYLSYNVRAGSTSKVVPDWLIEDLQKEKPHVEISANTDPARVIEINDYFCEGCIKTNQSLNTICGDLEKEMTHGLDSELMLQLQEIIETLIKDYNYDLKGIIKDIQDFRK